MGVKAQGVGAPPGGTQLTWKPFGPNGLRNRNHSQGNEGREGGAPPGAMQLARMPSGSSSLHN